MDKLAEEYRASGKDIPFYHWVAKKFGLSGGDATQRCWDHGFDPMTGADKK